MLPPVVDRAIPIRNLVRATLALVVVGFLVWFFASGTFRSVDERLIREKILALGPLGPIAFVLGFALIQPLGPSGHIFPLAASLVSGCVRTVYDGGSSGTGTTTSPSAAPELDAHTRRLGI